MGGWGLGSATASSSWSTIPEMTRKARSQVAGAQMSMLASRRSSRAVLVPEHQGEELAEGICRPVERVLDIVHGVDGPVVALLWREHHAVAEAVLERREM